MNSSLMLFGSETNRTLIIWSGITDPRQSTADGLCDLIAFAVSCAEVMRGVTEPIKTKGHLKKDKRMKEEKGAQSSDCHLYSHKQPKKN